VHALTTATLKPEQFIDNYKTILKGSKRWQELEAPKGSLYEW